MDDPSDEEEPDEEHKQVKRQAVAEKGQDDRDLIPLPARRSNMDVGGQLLQFPVIAHGDPVMRERLERMAAIKDIGGLPSLPNLKQPFFGGVGAREITAILAAMAIFSTLNAMRQITSSPSFPAVRASEQHAARGLSRLSQSGRPGSRGGFGGIHTQAQRFRTPAFVRKVSPARNQRLRRFIGLTRPSGSLPFGQEFDETGF